MHWQESGPMTNPLQHHQFICKWVSQRWKTTHMLLRLKVLLYHYDGLRTIVPRENCPPDNCPLDDCPPDNCPQGKLPSRKISLRIIAPCMIAPDYCFWIITSKIIAPWHYPPGDFPRRKLPFRWFAAYIIAYIIAPLTNSPKENCPLGKFSQG